MHRHALSETAGMASSRSSRSHSFSSDKTPSLASSVTFQMPTTVRPAPAYIAASVASQTVTDHHNAHDADADELQNAIFSEQALALLNAFLDHLLFAFLSSARSPSLATIRPAVSDVLKPRLAREAVEAADEELEGLLAGEDDDELATEPARADRWDVEKVWKRTRLRIMVYTRLGELEDEDEERYVQQERGLSMDDDDDDEAGLVAWASAIFLTSVIEYVAEQLLLVAGSAAFARMAARMKKLAQQTDDHEQQPIERLVIEEPDVEKIALNSALGRLWRTWRKRVRSPMAPISPGRGVHAAASYPSLHHRKASRETINTLHSEHEPLPEHRPTETDIAANIPLPIGDNDVNEIEVPGLAPTFEEEAESSGMQTSVQSARRQRPSSVLVLSSNSNKSNRPRPISMPLRPAPFFTVPADQESPSPATDTTSGDEDERQESPEPDASMVAFAAATRMGFRRSAVGSSETKEDQAEPPAESPPKVMRSKRMSIERPGPPGLVRTFSTRSSSLKSPIHTPLATPQALVHSEGRSYLDDDMSDDEPEQHRAIGVARTSDNVIRSVSSSPGDSPRDRSKRPGSGGDVEVPRSVAPTPLTYGPSSNGKPSVPERSVARKEVNRRSFNGAELGPVPNEGPTSAPRRQDASRSVSHGSSLPALHEVESNTPRHRGKTASINTSRSVRTSGSPRRSPTSATDVSERRPHRLSADGSMRSQHMQADKSSSDNSSLKRGASTSSSLRRQGAYPMAASGRESSASHRSRGLSGRMSEEDRAREFDSLVKGQETVKFTLTPESVRTGDKESPVLRKVEPRRPSTSSVAVYPRVNAEDKSFGTANLPNTTAQRARGPTAAQHKPSPSRKVVTRPLARDPKIESESMRDFADFIRSTGPSPGQEKPVQPFVSISGNGQKSGNQSTSSLGRKMSLSKHSGSANGSAVRVRPNMEPRSPAGLSTGNGDLIDFIRQGPPDANHGQPRIPRNVAPFRTTVDSDQFETMLGGHGNVESAYGSAASTLESKDSTQTINSRTGLIPSPSVVQPAYSNTPQQLSGSMSGPDSEPHITRTRRRVKDPYAIDLSDEDDDDEDEDQLTALPTPTNQLPPSRHQAAPRQESLMDFLNGMDPPSTSKPQPFMLSEETIAAARARAASSNPSLSSAASTTRNHNDYGTTAQPFGSISSSNGSNKPKLQARAPAVVGDVRGGGGMNGSRSATGDLADFLKNSGPPEMAPKKEEEKKSKRFWRRGKTYGDLP